MTVIIFAESHRKPGTTQKWGRLIVELLLALAREKPKTWFLVTHDHGWRRPAIRRIDSRDGTSYSLKRLTYHLRIIRRKRSMIRGGKDLCFPDHVCFWRRGLC